jgi:putative flippase GtrA
MGFALQVALTEMLTTVWHWPLALSTLSAVEGAVLHNFIWHERWTWRDAVGLEGRMKRCIAFHVANGLISIVGHVAIGGMLAGVFGLNVLMRTSIAVGVLGIVNFLLADHHVFVRRAMT